MDTIDLNNIPSATIDFLLDEIEENEKQLNSVSTLDLWIRGLWNINSFVEVYSTTSTSWFKGNIIKIHNNNNNIEYLEVKYMNNIKQTRTLQTQRNDMNNIRPFSKAMPIYKYIFSALNNFDFDIDFNTAFTPEKTPMISDLDELSPDDLNDNENDSDTPEPTDTPQPPVDGYGCSININYQDNSIKLSDEDDTSSSPPFIKPKMCGSRSCGYWEQKTMTRVKRASSIIKSITPITQRVAEMKINNFVRRRSVANIDYAVHKLYKLDPDLLKIREEFEERLDKEEYEFEDSGSDGSEELM